MRRPLSACLLLLATGAVGAADWKVRADASSLRFSGVAQGEAFEGKFARFAPQIRFDPAALDGARFDVSIDLASVDSRNQERDEALVGSEFFDVASYPQARFIATEFVAAEGGAFEARGALELRGVRQPVTLRFRWSAIEGGARLDGEATLDRTRFGVGGGDWEDAETIAHEVEVRTTLVLSPAG